MDERFHRLMEFETARAESYYSRGRDLLPLIEETSRPALWAMMEIYRGLLRKIIQRRFDVFNGPIRLSTPEKAAIAMRALAMRFIPGAAGSR
jgi:phytoene synthase